MIAENKAEFDKAGITAWHEAGYLGQGVKIAVLDADPYITDYMAPEGVYYDPMGVDDGKGGSGGHTASVAKVIHEEVEGMIDIVMQLGSKTAVVNGETVELLEAPQAKNGVTKGAGR